MASEVDACVEFSKLEKCKSRKRKSARSLSSMLNEKLNFETSTKKEFKLLQQYYYQLQIKKMVKCDTDNEMGDENNLKVISLNQVVKVSGTVEIQTTK